MDGGLQNLKVLEGRIRDDHLHDLGFPKWGGNEYEKIITMIKVVLGATVPPRIERKVWPMHKGLLHCWKKF